MAKLSAARVYRAGQVLEGLSERPGALLGRILLANPIPFYWRRLPLAKYNLVFCLDGRNPGSRSLCPQFAYRIIPCCGQLGPGVL